MSTASPICTTLFALLLASLAACNDSGSDDTPTTSTESINPPVTEPDAIKEQDAPVETINPQALESAGFALLAVGQPKFDPFQPDWGQVELRSAAEWQATWEEMSLSGDGFFNPAKPQADFSKFMVVGVRGWLSQCQRLGIHRVESSSNSITVHWWRGNPDPQKYRCEGKFGNSGYHAVLFYMMLRSSLPVQFVEHTAESAHPAWVQSLYAQTAPYENRMPQVNGSGSPACTQLVVPFAVRAINGSLPPSLKVKAVAVWQDGWIRWLQAPSSSETGITQGRITESNWLQDATEGTPDIQSEPVLRGVARGCTSAQFKLDQQAMVSLSLVAADGQTELTTYGTLTAAY